jgi:hypothetical protein
MNTNENIRNDASEDVVELGVASVETKGHTGFMEQTGGQGQTVLPGISEE